jgi:N-acetylmuramic acid 6-phosphate etherase
MSQETAPHSLLSQLDRLATESVNPNTRKIDQLSALEICKLINKEDQTVPIAVTTVLPRIAQAAEQFAETLRSGGRVFYIGAGTSGRLGVLDAAECPPTFGSDPAQIVGLIAGGYATLIASAEGVEDDEQAAVTHLREYSLSSADLVIGIAASTRTPYTLAGVAYADQIGCRTYLILCNDPVAQIPAKTIPIVIPVGPEVITGSTRMKSGTAQKLVLNMISTTAMILNGKTYSNRMVDLVARSAKLAVRSRKILIELLGCSLEEAEELIQRSNGSVKVALAMHRKNLSVVEALELLKKHDGKLWKILGPLE